MAWNQRNGRKIPEKIRQQVFERDGWQCQIRMPERCTGVATQIDHIIGWADGGTNSLDNLRGACRPCNAKRGSEQGHLAQGIEVQAKRRKPPNPGLAHGHYEPPESPWITIQREREEAKRREWKARQNGE
ncbi:HNH endonuclease [Mycolicibacterium conceptionense]|uniref:HNH endonuclease n=1 Tax=Mycolicibacterium conceptionense TaxID=451644 RepID=UPI0009BF8552|nr:HNH endonuclease [Mycolicibacterium conceptionense]